MHNVLLTLVGRGRDLRLRRKKGAPSRQTRHLNAENDEVGRFSDLSNVVRSSTSCRCSMESHWSSQDTLVPAVGAIDGVKVKETGKVGVPHWLLVIDWRTSDLACETSSATCVWQTCLLACQPRNAMLKDSCLEMELLSASEEVLAELVEDALFLSPAPWRRTMLPTLTMSRTMKKASSVEPLRSGRRASLCRTWHPLAPSSAPDRPRYGTVSTQEGQELSRFWILRCFSSGEHDSSSL